MTLPRSLHFVTAFDSKSSSSLYERNMYQPFADAMNHALEYLSDIQVDGLPKLEVPIAFVPCDKNVSSDRDSPGSAFKPDLAIMTLEDARKLYGLSELDAPKVSQLVSKIPKGSSAGPVGWKTILSAVEMKRKENPSRWPPLGAPGSQDKQDADRQLSEEPDASKPTTRKIDTFLYGHSLNESGSNFIGDLGIFKTAGGCRGDGFWCSDARQQTAADTEELHQECLTKSCRASWHVRSREVFRFIFNQPCAQPACRG